MGVFSSYANQTNKAERSITGSEISQGQSLTEELVQTQGRVVSMREAQDSSVVITLQGEDGFQFYALVPYETKLTCHAGDQVKITGVTSNGGITAREISVLNRLKERVLRHVRVVDGWAYGFGFHPVSCRATGLANGVQTVAIVTDSEDRSYAEAP